jgi:hypothetical protein
MALQSRFPWQGLIYEYTSCPVWREYCSPAENATPKAKPVILSIALVKAGFSVLRALLCRWRSSPKISEITRLSTRPDKLGFKKDDGRYISCKEFTEFFPRLAYLEIGVGYTENGTLQFSEREVTNSKMVSRLTDLVSATLCCVWLMYGGRRGIKMEQHWNCWVRHMVLTCMSDLPKCPFEIVLSYSLEIAEEDHY